MVVAVWIALAVFAVALAASGTVAALRGLRMWRAFRALSETAADALDSLSRGAHRAEHRAAALSDGGPGLEAATGHLRRSLAELEVLSAAAAETLASVARLRGSVPRR
ncbi:MAG: hypothetical protein ACRDM1_11575 [Gaiellaceae bacterium]